MPVLSKYDQRGVSASKSEVHDAIKSLDKGIYPTAFCKILPDVVGNSAHYCNIMHADTAGTKTSLAYMYWRETGDLSVWDGIAQDAIVMNLDDMACVGCTDDIILSSTIGRNKTKIPGEVISRLIQATPLFVDNMRHHGVNIHLAGGETADVGDIVRTIDVGYTAFARMKKSQLVINNIQAGDVIVGFSSSGLAQYETAYNGGMGSNGLTSARHDVFAHQYASKYPECYDSNLPKEVVFCGQRNLTDVVEIPGQVPQTAGKLVLSPTRTYLPILNEIFAKHRKQIHGAIHCTGGGQTKVLKFLSSNVQVVKDNLFEIPPLFRLIKDESSTPWREMYQVFNMGHRLELYVPPRIAQKLIQISESYGVAAQIIGAVKPHRTQELVLHTPDGEVLFEN